MGDWRELVDGWFSGTEDDPAPVCREERQYALFVYHRLLLGEQGALWDACGIPAGAQLDSLLYEATFMRDLFARDRQERTGRRESFPVRSTAEEPDCFNARLLDFVRRLPMGTGRRDEAVRALLSGADCPASVPANRNLGGWRSPQNPYEKLMRWMMNAKPDLALLYTLSGRHHLRFLECKYLCGEAPYQRAPHIAQTDVQDLVGRFLCGTLLGGQVLFDGAALLRLTCGEGGPLEVRDLLPPRLTGRLTGED